MIETPLDDDLDLGGWDIRKALSLMVASNAIVLKWLGSPIVYRRDPDALDALNALAGRLEVYAFRQKPKVEFDDVLKAPEAVRKDAALADDATSPNSDETVDRGRWRVLALLEEDGPAADAEVARLADYRIYFTYDVEMRSARTGAVVGRLSQRLRTESGGEREAPSYAAVGTALAAANNIEIPSRQDSTTLTWAGSR